MDRFILVLMSVFISCSSSQKISNRVQLGPNLVKPFLSKSIKHVAYSCDKEMKLTKKGDNSLGFTDQMILEQAYCATQISDYARSIYLYDYLYSKTNSNKVKDDILLQLARIYYLNNEYDASTSSLKLTKSKSGLYYYYLGLNQLADFKLVESISSFTNSKKHLKQSVLVESAKHIALILLSHRGVNRESSFSDVYKNSAEFNILAKIHNDLKNGDKSLDAVYTYNGQYNLVRSFIELIRKNEN